MLGDGTPRARLLSAAVTLFVLAMAPTADATLRSPHTQSSCNSGYSYGEDTFIYWKVEGCKKSVSPHSDEVKRVQYQGKLEVNGMLVESGSAGLTAIQTEQVDSGDGRTSEYGKLKADDATLVLDPKVGGERKRFVLFQGRLDLQITGLSVTQLDPGTLNPHGPQPAPRAAGLSSATVTLPKTGTPGIFGLRLREAPVATVTPSGMSFDANLSLGSAASALLRDWTDEVPVSFVEGQGMSIEGLHFNIPEIAIEGIGGLRHLKIDYDGGRNVWSGDVDLDLGDLIGSFQLAAEINASTGAPNYMRITVGNLNMPIGSTGILLQRVGIDLGFNPMGFGANIGVSAGPQVFGNALILGDGSVDVNLEPSFRLEAGGSLRFLVSGDGQFARGDTNFIYDSDGLIAVSANVRAEASAFGLGVAATIGGSGAYASDRNRFNIQAHATGKLLLGVFGDIDVVQVKAVLSSEGWGACTHLLFVDAGVGQDWDHGLELVGCDLSDFAAPVDTSVHKSGAGVSSRRFTFRPEVGDEVLLLHLTADRPGPRVRLRGPNGQIRLVTSPDQHGRIDANAGVFSQPTSREQYVMIRKPQRGRWTVEWASDPSQPQITGLRTAQRARPIKAKATVSRRKGDRPGRRRLRISRTETVDKNETIVVGIQTSKGFIPLGSPSAARSFEVPFDEIGVGTRKIVARVQRRGIPLREVVIGTYKATLPPPPRALSTTCRRGRLTIKARLAKGAEAPDAWQYVLRTQRSGRRLAIRAKVGKAVSVALPARLRRVIVLARPVVRGRALRGKTRSKIARVC